MVVRKADGSDRDTLLAIWLRSVRATHTLLTEEHIQSLVPVVRDEALLQLEIWVLCCAAGNAVGFIGLSGSRVETLFIAPEWCGHGGGTLLLEKARRLKGAHSVDVNEQNREALRFYLTRGFKIVGRSPVDAQGNPFPLLHLREVSAEHDSASR